MSTKPIDLAALRIDRENAPPPQQSERKPSRRWLWGGLIVLVVVALGTYLVRSWGISPIEVKVASVTSISAGQAMARLNASGYVVAQRQADVASTATGRLVALYVGPGDRVKSGQIIARIDNTDVSARLDHARANQAVAEAGLTQARATAAEAKLDFDRKKRLLDEHLVSSSEFDAVEAKYATAQAGVASAESALQAAKAAVHSAEIDVEHTVIRAPFDGTVLSKSADVGEVVAPFGASSLTKAAVVRVADMNSLLVEADVSERNLDQVKINAPCEILLDAFPSHPYRGVVVTIVPTADRAKATVLTKIRFVDRDERVLPDMSAKVAFLDEPSSEVEGAAPRAAVPSTAVVKRDGGSAVFVVRDDRAVETPVHVGAAANGLLEVSGPIAVGDRVVVDPSNRLQSGSRIKEIGHRS